MNGRVSLNMSLHELSVRNPWFPTHPLLWTERHLQLVNCTFQQLETPTEAGEHQEDTVGDVEDFATEWECGMKGFCFRLLVDRDGSPWKPAAGAPAFDYAQHEIYRLDCGIYLTPAVPPSETSPARLMVSPYEYAWATDRRRAKCYPWKHAAGEEAAQRLCERRLRQCAPETWTRDPYLVCIMLSLAQDDWYRSLHQSYPVCLIVCNETDKANAYVYHAEFPLDITEGLKTPSLRISTWPTIYYTKIPFEPYGSFLDHLTTRILGVKEVNTSIAELTKERQRCDGSDSTERGCKRVIPNILEGLKTLISKW
ncbi:uncharacterized protein FIESC28_00246 [Fusarium coffeatum]|uniref:Uncharacterized protein n=1 Tax=Fusarium coffeatum TaxID=231269 RepID=A0A366SDJ9_9HYPO|nr:uncharacterized protein FIESC28_00246 [Fusarium coffeatum]RBR26978.1 hypothetical protein FIESC28_00246 [Fusarium coffeatum]